VSADNPALLAGGVVGGVVGAIAEIALVSTSALPIIGIALGIAAGILFTSGLPDLLLFA
jgi:hypothetical protein